MTFQKLCTRTHFDTIKSNIQFSFKLVTKFSETKLINQHILTVLIIAMIVNCT